MESNVAMNKMMDEDFRLGVQSVLLNYTRDRANPGFKINVTERELDRYFEPTHTFDIDVVENSLLPTRFFYKKFPDSVRVFVNETNTNQSEVRDAIELEIAEKLRNYGIDLKNKNVTIK